MYDLSMVVWHFHHTTIQTLLKEVIYLSSKLPLIIFLQKILLHMVTRTKCTKCVSCAIINTNYTKWHYYVLLYLLHLHEGCKYCHGWEMYMYIEHSVHSGYALSLYWRKVRLLLFTVPFKFYIRFFPCYFVMLSMIEMFYLSFLGLVYTLAVRTVWVYFPSFCNFLEWFCEYWAM